MVLYYLKLISCPYLIYPLVLDNTGIIMNIEHNTKYPSNPISGHTPTDQCVKRKRRLMGSACKWMEHPPLTSSPRFAVVRLVQPLPSVYHCSGQTLLYTTLAKCPKKW